MKQSDNEITLIRRIAEPFPRHPMQVNQLFEADGEILDIRALSKSYLVVKTDGIHEEIKKGLYKDPHLIGWMAVTVAISDLAAAGADPVGLLLSLQIPQLYDEDWMKSFQSGINDACKTYGTFVIGGDTNFSEEISIVTTAIGGSDKPLLRKPLQPGDLMYLSAPLGAGNSFAYSVFFDHNDIPYKPTARLKESQIIRKFATACIDTSDGLFPAISVLAELNQIGIDFFHPLQAVLCNTTQEVYKRTRIPAWTFLAGPHGEYELLFSIHPSQKKEFIQACDDINWRPVLIGVATECSSVNFISEDQHISCEASTIANLFGVADGDIQQYFLLLMQQHEEWVKTKTTANVR